MVDGAMSFSQIAHVYDRFNDLSVYEHWLDFTLSSRDSAPIKVLDAACGTGWFTQLLAPFCERIIGFDYDPAMIRVAENEKGESQNSEYIVADMLDLRHLAQDFDLVTCYADSLCFLADESAVQQALRQLAERLRPGGQLLFDVWTPQQIEKFDMFSYCEADEQAALIWRSESDIDHLTTYHDLTVFEQVEGIYQRYDVTLIERTYLLEVYRKMLVRAGFEQIEILVNYGESYYDEQQHQTADRWFFRCVKRGDVPC